MTFLHPILLWGLPAALLPVVIHLLNRLRFRSVKWAAMMFLISATRSSTKRARLRHYLILLCRVLVILLLVLALSRPTIGGWLGGTMAGAPDTVIILLDRSASMEATDPRRQCSKREHALRLFARAAAESAATSRFVLIESVLRTPHEIATPAVLAGLAMASATDTAADIPAMFQAALDYLIRNKTGRTELWVASDLQASNWLPQRREWPQLGAQLAALPQDVRVRLLALSDGYHHNVAVGLQHAQRRVGATPQALRLALDISSAVPRPDVFPMIITLDGTRSQVDLTLNTPTLHYQRNLELPDGKHAGGWGKVELPADENLRDNSCYFVYGDDVPLAAVVVSDTPAVARYLRLAASPVAGRFGRACEVLAPSEAATIAWQDLALLIWQAPPPGAATAQAVDTFIADGGTVLYFPPGGGERAAGTTPDSEPLGPQWGAIDTAGTATPFRVPVWEAHDGPLADTAGGLSLPLDRLAFRQRRDMTTASDDTWIALARFADGKPFLLRHASGAGRAFICTALPGKGRSDLGEGSVLVPMLQRMVRSGGQRLARAETARCGEWQPRDPQEVWTAVDTSEHKHVAWQAGVYQCGTRRVALNRPASERMPEVTPSEDIEVLLGDLRVQILDDLAHRSTDKLQSEVWPILLSLCMVCLLVESGLLLSNRRPRSKEVAS